DALPIWIPATALGGALYWILFLATSFVYKDLQNFLSTENLAALGLMSLFGAVAGASLGIAQRWALPDARQIPGAVWWIVGSAVGWAVALGAGDGLNTAFFHKGSENLYGLLMTMMSLDLGVGIDRIGPRTLILAIYAAITGITLVGAR